MYQQTKHLGHIKKNDVLKKKCVIKYNILKWITVYKKKRCLT